MRGFSKLLTPAASNAKTAKQGEAYEAAIMHFAHKNTVCPWSTKGCREACLNTSGRSQVTGNVSRANLLKYDIHRARIARTQLYWKDQNEFFTLLYAEVGTLYRRAVRHGKKCVVRLNGTSDITWERIDRSFFYTFPNVQFYDYTKSRLRALRSVKDPGWPANYHLTYSRSEEDSEASIREMLDVGVSVAVVFLETLPETYLGVEVIDGNAHDFRFTDPRGVVVGLTAKARAKADETGFVVDPLADRHGPSLEGSRLCRNARKSIAAGGDVLYCTCAACF